MLPPACVTCCLDEGCDCHCQNTKKIQCRGARRNANNSTQYVIVNLSLDAL